MSTNVWCWKPNKTIAMPMASATRKITTDDRTARALVPGTVWAWIAALSCMVPFLLDAVRALDEGSWSGRLDPEHGDGLGRQHQLQLTGIGRLYVDVLHARRGCVEPVDLSGCIDGAVELHRRR